VTEFVGFPKIARLSRSVIILTNGGNAFCDESDFKSLSSFPWFHVIDGNNVYAARSNGNGRLVRMHTEIMGFINVDHINGDGLDNRRCNLRQATNSQNQMNRGKFSKSSSMFKGVTFLKNDKRWWARISVGGKRIDLGRFISEVDAAKAYDNSANYNFGAFARTNKI